MRIPSGSTDQKTNFVAFDENDSSILLTGLTDFTVYRSRNGSTPVLMTTPTITELDSTNMEGVYVLLIDEDTTIDSSSETEEMIFYITSSGMKTFLKIIEIYRPIDDIVLDDINSGEIDSGQTITLSKALRATFNRFFRTVTQTSTTQSVKNDSDTIIASMSTSDNGTTQTKGAS